MSRRSNELGGRDAGLASVHNRYSTWLRQVLIGRYGPDDADDLFQETWLRIARYADWTNVRYPRAFLLRVAVNLAQDRVGRRIKRDRLLLEVQKIGGSAVEQPAQTEALVAKELVLGLPQPLRDVFVLSRVGGLSNSQIAEQLGISPKTVEWRMTKALAHCAAQLRR